MKTLNTKIINQKMPTEHVSPANKGRVQQAGRTTFAGSRFLTVYPALLFKSKLIVISECLVISLSVNIVRPTP